MKAEAEQQSSRGEKQDMTSDDYEQGRGRDETAQGQKPNGHKAGPAATAELVGVREGGGTEEAV